MSTFIFAVKTLIEELKTPKETTDVWFERPLMLPSFLDVLNRTDHSAWSKKGCKSQALFPGWLNAQGSKCYQQANNPALQEKLFLKTVEFLKSFTMVKNMVCPKHGCLQAGLQLLGPGIGVSRSPKLSCSMEWRWPVISPIDHTPPHTSIPATRDPCSLKIVFFNKNSICPHHLFAKHLLC